MLTKLKKVGVADCISRDGHTVSVLSPLLFLQCIVEFYDQEVGSVSLPLNPGLHILGTCTLGALSQLV